MYISLPRWLALSAALLQTATAFYPYHYGDTDSSSNSRRAMPLAPNANARSITLPLRRVSTALRTRQNAYSIIDSNDPKQANSVAIDQDGQDLSYMVAVIIGDSKEEYHLLLDSAASNTWVMAQDCTSEACKTHTTFGKGDSSTLKVRFDKSHFRYGHNVLMTRIDSIYTLQRNLRHRLGLRHARLRHPTHRPAHPRFDIRPRNERVPGVCFIPHGWHIRHRPRRKDRWWSRSATGHGRSVL